MMVHNKCRGKPFKTSTLYWFHAQARLFLGMVGNVLHLGLVHLPLVLLGLANQATNVRRGRGLIVNRTLYDLEASIPTDVYVYIIEGLPVWQTWVKRKTMRGMGASLNRS